MRLTSQIFLTSAIIATVLVPPSSWARDKRDDISKIGEREVAHKTEISQKKENEIGKKAAAEYESKSKVIMDPAVVSYIDRVAQKVVLNSDLRIPLLVKVVSSPDQKAEILPGGFMYISSGLIQNMNDEGQLAGVIAFGAADVATRHWASRETKAAILQYAMVPLISTPMTYGTYHGVMQSYRDGVPLAFLKFSREDVAESDYFAVQYLYKAGYDPNSYLALLDKFAKAEDSQANKPPESLRDRPPARQRMAFCQKEIESILPPRAPTRPDNSEFAKIKALLETASKPSGTP